MMAKKKQISCHADGWERVLPAYRRRDYASPIRRADAPASQGMLSEGEAWGYQLKLDGYRAIAFKSGGKLHLRSRNDKDFAVRYPEVLKGLPKLPDDTVIDGEGVAFDHEGRPSFNALQNFGSAPAPVA